MLLQSMHARSGRWWIRRDRRSAPGERQPTMADEAEFVACEQTIYAWSQRCCPVSVGTAVRRTCHSRCRRPGILPSAMSHLIRRVARCPISTRPAGPRPTQPQPAPAGQAEFVICDKPIERLVNRLKGSRRVPRGTRSARRATARCSHSPSWSSGSEPPGEAPSSAIPVTAPIQCAVRPFSRRPGRLWRDPMRVDPGGSDSAVRLPLPECGAKEG